MRRREHGELEQVVLAAMQSSGETTMSVAEVQRLLPGDPAYTTVMTTMARLADKGALTRMRAGRAFRYTLAAPAESVEDAVTARRMRRLLSDGSDRAGVLARFVAELDPDEERMLLGLLGQREQDPT